MVQRARALILSPDRSTVVVGIPVPLNPAVLITICLICHCLLLCQSGQPLSNGRELLNTYDLAESLQALQHARRDFGSEKPEGGNTGEGSAEAPLNWGPEGGEGPLLATGFFLMHASVQYQCREAYMYPHCIRGQAMNPCADRYQETRPMQRDDALAAYWILQAL